MVPWVCLQFAIVVFPDHTHLLFILNIYLHYYINMSNSYILESFTFLNRDVVFSPSY